MRRPSARALVVTLVVAALLLAVVGVLAVRRVEPSLHALITSSLAASLESEIELGRVHVSWFPPKLNAERLTVRHHGRTDAPPLLVIASFIMDLNPLNLWSRTVDEVSVDGMEVNIPPRDASGRRFPPSKSGDASFEGPSTPIVVGRLTARNTRLAVIPSTAGKSPKVWDIHSLVMHNLSSAGPATYEATLTNPIPVGTIDSKGRFGPWTSGEPGLTPLDGEYTFAADLGTIKGLEGDLNSHGVMSGILERITTTGETSTRAFRLTALDGKSLPLKTSYEAVVDGTKGDVDLKKVDVRLGRSLLYARGTVEGTKGIKGKRVVLNVTSQAVDLRELLGLVTTSNKLTPHGVLALNTAFDLPQGKIDVLDRLALEGSFTAASVRFADPEIQEKIDGMSRQAQGRPEDTSIDETASKVRSGFLLTKGVLWYRDFSFEVPGASVTLNGKHDLRARTLDLGGEVRLRASVSETQTGFKNWLLKPFDPLFRRKGAGTRLAITIQGAQDKPKVDLEWVRTLKGR